MESFPHIVGLKQVWFSGSRARKTHRPFSGIDILIEALDNRVAISQINELHEISSLPFLLDVASVDDLKGEFDERVLAERVLLWEWLVELAMRPD